jgi:hypothetical protein
MSAQAGQAPTGKVWHVDTHGVSLCGRGDNFLRRRRPLATVPAFGLCQHCERAAEQITEAIRAVQS